MFEYFYRFASETHRDNLTVTPFRAIVTQAVTSRLPLACVRASKKYWVVESPIPISDGDFRMIGRDYCSNALLGQHVKVHHYKVDPATNLPTKRTGQLFHRYKTVENGIVTWER